MKLFLFELAGRSILGYVDIDKENQTSLPEVTVKELQSKNLLPEVTLADFEIAEVLNPAIVSMAAIQVPNHVQVPGKPMEQTMIPVLLPYYIDRIILFLDNVMGYSEIPENHFFQDEMKRIVLHFRQAKEETPRRGAEKFTPKVVQ